MNDEAILIQINKLTDFTQERHNLQNELKRLRGLTPSPAELINTTLKEVQGYHQDILDLSMFVMRQKPNDHLLNRKKWITIEQVLKSEQEQINGILSSPTIALMLLQGSTYNMPKPPVKKILEFPRC